MVTEPVLRGYILEELLAYALQGSGYDLLVAPSQDSQALGSAGNGLQIHGRGADHQVDALGQLRVRLPFLYPIRLFLEAKCRQSEVDLPDVRNAVGVITDVNEFYSSTNGKFTKGLPDRYDYRYALFSTSGFTKPAEKYAIVHQISLVDLSAPRLSELPDAAMRLSKALHLRADNLGLDEFPVRRLRTALRMALGTWPHDVVDEAGPKLPDMTPEVRSLLHLATTLSADIELDDVFYAALTESPFLLLLRSVDPDIPDHLRARTATRSQAELRQGRPAQRREVSTIDFEAGARRVTFDLTLPPELEHLTFDSDRTNRMRHEASPRLFLITEDEPVQLDIVPGRPLPDPAKQGRTSQWTQSAFDELMKRLRAEGRVRQAAVIEFAARHGGVITRDDIYRVGKVPMEKKLVGFTKPPRRIARDLVEVELLHADAVDPLAAQYRDKEKVSWASHYTVPHEFISFVH